METPGIPAAYLRYFCAKDSGNIEQIAANEANRRALYKHVAASSVLLPIWTTPSRSIPSDVDHYEKVRTEVKLDR